MTIIYGLLGLGLVIIIHEAGHFIAARLSGVTVETFSVGMGPVLAHKKIKDTDYRISLIPLGGYCGMKGEKAFQEALDNKLSEIPSEPGSFYGVHPLKRLFIAFSGPFFNFLFAIISFSIISLIGYTYYTTSNKIILASEVYENYPSIAMSAGIKTGDRITQINDTEISYFKDISEIISLHPQELLTVEVDRNGEKLQFELTPELDPETGAGKIGIVSWIDPIVDTVVQGSSAALAGIQKGDLITSVDGKPVKNTVDLQLLLTDKTEVNIQFLRDANIETRKMIIIDNKVGISFVVNEIHTPKYGFLGSIKQGVLESVNMLKLTIKSIGLLFKGVDVTKAVSGPVRITVMLGETAKSGFSLGFSTGVITVLNFLSLISISLFLMNLLPIPVLDGGLILFALIEWISRRKLHPKFLYNIQFVGIAFILFIFVFALFGDISYLISGAK
mgnify:CR=1 FL=1